jgi:hypothetical protein
MANRDTVKPWFQTDKRPTQNQFFSFFDWVWFKDEQIPALKIENLQELLGEKADLEYVNNRVTTAKIFPNGDFLVFKVPGNVDNTTLETNDVVKGIVENHIIEGIYLGGGKELLTDFEIITKLQL